jgi:hypothetical protein
MGYPQGDTKYFNTIQVEIEKMLWTILSPAAPQSAVAQ